MKNSENEILNNPQNYAAIYARVSSATDNNSIDAQIDKAKSVLNNMNLLVYGAYIDHVSGRTTPPHERKGFSKLLEDAELGLFKNLAVYKHDRLARSLKDWIELKNHLTKLGVKIIFSDESEYSSDNTLQGDFLENLLVIVAELEPNRINEKTALGRQRRSEQGVYTSPKAPFGYKREKISTQNDNSNVANIKSKFITIPLQAAFIEYIYNTFDSYIKNNTSRIKTVTNDLRDFFEELFENLSSVGFHMLAQKYKDTHKSNLIKAIESEYKRTGNLSSLKSDLDSIKSHLASPTNIISILTGSIYGGCKLKNSKSEDLGIISKHGTLMLHKSSYVNTINIFGIIEDFSLFERVYCYSNVTFTGKDDEPEYLFKGKLKCSLGKKMHLVDNLISCNHVGSEKQQCKYYSKTNLQYSILDIILDDVLKDCISESKSNNKDDIKGFKKFTCQIDEKVTLVDNEIKKLRNDKIDTMKKYLTTKDSSLMDKIYDDETLLLSKLRKAADYHKEIGYINKLKSTLKRLLDLNDRTTDMECHIKKIKHSLISYVMSNSDFFSSIFKNIISEIRVNTIEHGNNAKCEFTVEYKYSYSDSKKHSGVFESIH